MALHSRLNSHRQRLSRLLTFKGPPYVETDLLAAAAVAVPALASRSMDTASTAVTTGIGTAVIDTRAVAASAAAPASARTLATRAATAVAAALLEAEPTVTCVSETAGQPVSAAAAAAEAAGGKGRRTRRHARRRGSATIDMQRAGVPIAAEGYQLGLMTGRM